MWGGDILEALIRRAPMRYDIHEGVINTKSKIQKLIIGAAALAFAAALVISTAGVRADSLAIDFEDPLYTTGTIHNQDGWSSAGAAGSGCAVYDHKVAEQLLYPSFGDQSLRMSNAVTSGCFGDQTFSKSLTEAAGESSAMGDGNSSSPIWRHFEAQWDFASVTQTYQPDLSVVASPDRGDGARMSWIQMADATDGLQVNFYDYAVGNTVDTGPCGCAPFRYTTVVTGLDRSIPHTIKVTMDFYDGPQNDVVKVYVDGVLKHTGTSWEDYFRDEENNPTRTVDSILFRTGGASAPDTGGNGFLIDNLTLTSLTFVGPPTTKDQCKKNGWMTFNNPTFKNQGDCVSYVATGGRNSASGN